MVMQSGDFSGKKEISIIVVGTGFAGIGMGIKLKENGFNNFTIIEKANEVGGTWRENTYPGAACDIKSHLYSFSFEPNPHWTREFSPQPEILKYLIDVTDKHNLREHIRFNWEMKKASFDDETSTWKVWNQNGEMLEANFVVLGTGPLHIPQIPDIKGMGTFKGPVFHSAKWDHSVDLKGKRIASIGTGASAIQFVPEIAPDAEKLYLFQRTAPWIIPKPDGDINDTMKAIFSDMPVTAQINRALIYAFNEMQVVGFVYSKQIMKMLEKLANMYREKKVKDPELRAKLTPNYTIGCKRILLTNNYYDAVTRSNVDVITDGIKEVGENFIVTNDGKKLEVDVIICGTGFYVANSYQFMNVSGRNGVELNKLWKTTPEAYLGTTVSGFPNAFIMIGPNTGLGHNSMVFMIECQLSYIIDALNTMVEKGYKTMEVKQVIQDKFNEEIQKKLKNTVWNTGGCKSWYLTEDGKNATVWPDFTFRYKQKTKKINPSDFVFEKIESPVKTKKMEVAS